MRHHIRDGLFLHIRKGAKKKVWSIYAYVDGAEINRSTKTEDLDEAITMAEAVWDEAHERKRKHLSIHSPTFADLAEKYIKVSTRRLPEATKKKDLIRNVRSHLIPYVEYQHGAGARVDQLETTTFEDYTDWRHDRREELLERNRLAVNKKEKKLREKWKASKRIQSWTPNVEDYLKKHLPGGPGGVGEYVSASQINSELVLLNAIFKLGIKDKCLSKYDLPELYRESPDDNARPGFNKEEIDKIRATAKARFERAKTKAGEAYLKKMGKDIDAHNGYALGKAQQDVWMNDRLAWSRYRVMVAIDLLTATGLRPKSLCEMRRGHVVETPPGIDPRTQVRRNFLEGRVETEKPAYALTAQTRKGKKGKLKKRYIVPEEWSWETLDELLSLIPKNITEPLIGIQSRTLRDRIKDVIIEAGVEVNVEDETRSAYDIRHYYITRQLMKGMSVAVVAENTLTSVQMIDDYYNKLTSLHVFDQLAGRK